MPPDHNPVISAREMAQIYWPERPNYGAADIKRIRSAARMSQPVFARLLGVEKTTVAQWERGAKHPSGPAMRLLEVLDPARAESPLLRVRTSMDLPGKALCGETGPHFSGP